LQAEYLSANPEIAKQINEEVNESVEKERNIIIASSIPGVKLQESSKISEEDVAAQTKDWNKQIPGDEKTLIIDNKNNQEDKNIFKTWVKDTMTKYFPKEFFFMNRGGSFTNSSSRMAYKNQPDIATELDGVEFIKDNSGINWSIVGRINYSALAKKGTKYLVGVFKGKDKGAVALSELKKNFKQIKAQGKENMKVLKYAGQQFSKMYKDDRSTAKYIATWFKSASNNQDHILRFAAPLTAFSRDLSSGLREEHSLPSSLVGKYLFNAILNDNVNNSFKNIEQNYFQVALSVKADNKLKGDGFNFTSRMPDGWRMTDSTWARYFNDFVNSNDNGIDPDGIEFFDTGLSVAETFKVGLGKTGNRLSAFDFDDTLFETNSEVIVNKSDGSTYTLTAAQFAAHNLGKGEKYDFAQFDQVIRPQVLEGLNQLKDKLAKGDNVTILTARNMRAKGAVMKLMQEYIGKDANKIKFIGVGSSKAEAKATYLTRAINKYGYDNVFFTDDAVNNVNVVKDVLNKIPGLKSEVIQATPDLIKAQQNVVAEKADPTETIIASAKEEAYNKPAENKLSETEAVDALGDIFMANWNRDGDVNLNFVSDPAVIEEILEQDGRTKEESKNN
jgi:hypothetical protein